MDWLSPRGAVDSARARRVAAIAAGVAQFRHACAGLDFDCARSATPPIAPRPRNFTGKADNPATQILQNADIGWTASRGPITATRRPDVLSLATPLTGTLNVTGSLSSKATGAVSNALGSLLGDKAAKQIGSINIKDAERARRDQGQRHHARRGRSSRRPGISSRTCKPRSISATPAFRWPARGSTSRRRSSR